MAHHSEILREVAAVVDAGSLRPRLDERTFQLAEVEAAFAWMASGQARGKIVIDIEP